MYYSAGSVDSIFFLAVVSGVFSGPVELCHFFYDIFGQLRKFVWIFTFIKSIFNSCIKNRINFRSGFCFFTHKLCLDHPLLVTLFFYHNSSMAYFVASRIITHGKMLKRVTSGNCLINFLLEFEHISFANN